MLWFELIVVVVALVVFQVLLLWVVAVVMCRFPPSRRSLFTRSVYPVEKLKGRRVLGKQAYIYIYIHIGAVQPMWCQNGHCIPYFTV